MTTKELNNLSENFCPICGSQRLQTFLEISNVPVHCNRLWINQNVAKKCPKGDINLAYCHVCDFIINQAFDPSRLEYDQNYDTSLFFSTRFQKYARSLAKKLVDQHHLHNKEILEIGCGKGDFLALLCELGNNRGIGFDPAYDEEKPMEEEKQNAIEIIKDVYSEHYRPYQGDIIICRQTLEHIYDLKGFLNTIRRAIDNPLKTKVFFEVPNAINIFRRLFVWDIIYEHYSYFTPTSLVALFSSCGFTVSTISEEFEGQYLCVDASLQTPNAQNQSLLKDMNKFKPISRDLASFAVNYQRKLDTCNQRLEEIDRNGQRAVVWGGGSKGVTFLNQITNPQQIKYVVRAYMFQELDS
jgi:2-polyprenyl-3-methyl-5-hydroxy-6-metoxy-1,4-benzoquinol methylase